MGKTINEIDFVYKKLSKELAFGMNINTTLEVLSKMNYGVYWLFDMIAILGKIKFINVDVKYHGKLAALGWFLGTVLILAKFLLDLNNLLKKKQEEDPNKKDPAMDAKIFKLYINVIGKIGDIFPSSNILEIPHKLFGKGFNDGVVGFGGFTSGFVAVYNFVNK